MAVILRYFAEFGSFGIGLSFGSHYVKVVEVRPHTVCNKNLAQRI